MSSALVFVDHHKSPDVRITDEPQVTAVTAASDSDFWEEIASACSEPFDTIIVEEGVDSLMAGAIALIHQGGAGELVCIEGVLSAKTIRKLGKRNDRMLALHSRFMYESELDAFDDILFLNPWESNLTNACVSELLYRAIGQENPFLRDLAGFGIVGDYNVTDSQDTIRTIINTYGALFQELQTYVETDTLDKFAVMRSPFKPLLKRLRAPVILGGAREAKKMVELIVQSPPFTYTDLMGDSGHPVKVYLDKQYQKFQRLIDEEKMRFEMERRLIGRVLIFEPRHKSDNLARELADSIKDDRPDWIVAIKTRHGRREVKYSLRRGTLDIDLGQICRHMGVGGGNPFAAGAVVEDAQAFEDDFITEINQVIR